MVWREQRFLRLVMAGLVALSLATAQGLVARAETLTLTPSATPTPTPAPTLPVSCSAPNGSFSNNTELQSIVFTPTSPTVPGPLALVPSFNSTTTSGYAVDIPADHTMASLTAKAEITTSTIWFTYPGSPAVVLQSGNPSDPFDLSNAIGLVISVTSNNLCTDYTLNAQVVAPTPTPGATPNPTPTDTPTPTPVQIATPPLVTGVTPNIINPSTSSATLTIVGLNFDQTAVVNWDSHELSTQDLTASSLSATVPASFLTAIPLPFIAKITVLNPSTQILSQPYEVAVVDPKTTGQSVVYTGVNATAAISTLSASYSGSDPAGIFVAAYIKNPTHDSTLPSNSYWDVRFTPFGASGGSLTCVFTASGSPTGQQLYFFNSATGGWSAVQNAGLQINAGQNSMTVVFGQSSFPKLTDLTGTVFSIAPATGVASGGGLPWLILLLLLVLAGGGGGTYYWWWRNHQAPSSEVNLKFK